MSGTLLALLPEDMCGHVLTKRGGGVGPGTASREASAYCLRDVCRTRGPRAHLGKPHRTCVGASYCARPKRHKHMGQKHNVKPGKKKLEVIQFQEQRHIIIKLGIHPKC